MKLFIVAVLMALSLPASFSKVLSSRFEDQEDLINVLTSLLEEKEDEANDHPVLAKRGGGEGHCSATGDPHYHTFDGKYYNFMGRCRYVMTTDYCGGSHALGNFKVIQENVACGSPSCTNSVEVIIQGESIHLYRGTTSPAPKETATYSVRVEGAYVVVRTKPSGLTVKWDRSMGLYIDLEQKYWGKVCGLCGNFDGNEGNDFTTSAGAVVGDANTFGFSWQAGGKCGKPVTPQHPCELHPDKRTDALKDCEIITSNNFQSCRGALDLQKLYNDCVYDVCAGTSVTMKDSSCEAIKSASEECKEKTGKAVTWGHLEQKCSDSCQRATIKDGVRKCCHFPFTYKGTATFYDCVPQVTAGKRPWCSTEKNGGSWRDFGECI